MVVLTVSPVLAVPVIFIVKLVSVRFAKWGKIFIYEKHALEYANKTSKVNQEKKILLVTN